MGLTFEENAAAGNNNAFDATKLNNSEYTSAASSQTQFQKPIADPEKAEDPSTAPSNAPSEHSGHHERTIRGWKWFALLASLYTSAFLYGLDTSIAADVQGPIIEAFGEAQQLAWVGSGFPLGSVAAILPFGALFGRFNMKWLFITGFALFEVGSVLCGAAPNLNALIIGRVIAGMGGAAIYLGALNYVSALTTAAERGTYIALIGFWWGLGVVLGPLIGGSFADSSATWRWAFYINLVVGAAVTPGYFFLMPSIKPASDIPVKTRLATLDYLGFFLSAGAWVFFAVAFTMGGIQYAWSDSRSIALVVMFAVFFIAYILQQYFMIFTSFENRSFPAHLLRSLTQNLLALATAASTSSVFVVIYFIPIYFQFVHNDSALMAAVRLLPYVIVLVFVNLLSGHLLSRVKYYMPVYLVAGIFILVGGALLYAYLDPSTPQSYIYGFTVINAIGTGLAVQIGYSVATVKVGDAEAVNAISIQNVFQIGSTTFALTVAGHVFQSNAAKNLAAVLAGQGYTPAEIQSAVTGAQSEVFRHLTGELRAQAILAITHAMKQTYIFAIAGGAAVVVASVFMKRERLTF